MAKEKESKTIERPPVVAVLGHIDHGKSTLLDFIRKSTVVEHEVGGITQHVNAYEIFHTTKEGKEARITFIDTPGHAAFATSRRRGANIADIAIIIISAEEGVKEQTLESIKVAESAGVPFIIAINKIDKPNANPEKVKSGLVEHRYYVEGYGGSIPCVLISSKTGDGISELLDIIILLSDLEGFSGNKKENASGFVLESFVDGRVGITATLIIKNGTLSIGDYFINDHMISKIKRLEYFDGTPMKEASFSQPVHIYGLSEMALPGETFKVFSSKNDALLYQKELSPKNKIVSSVEFKEGEEDTRMTFPLVIKGDYIGTLEAICQEGLKLSTDRVRVKILASGIGNITEKDIKLAESAENPIIIGFNVKIDKAGKDLAENDRIPVHMFNIVYRITEFLEKELIKRTPKITEEVLIGKAKVIRLFSETKKAQVLGAKVLEGNIKNGAIVKVHRNKNEIGQGKIKELQKDRVPAKEAREGDQFGATIERKVGIALGDELLAYELIEK